MSVNLIELTISIISTIAGSVLAAIIFYYISIFLYEKRELRKYKSQLNELNNLFSNLLVSFDRHELAESKILRMYFEKCNSNHLDDIGNIHTFLKEFNSIQMNSDFYKSYQSENQEYAPEYKDLQNDISSMLRVYLNSIDMTIVIQERLELCNDIIESILKTRTLSYFELCNDGFENINTKIKYLLKLINRATNIDNSKKQLKLICCEDLANEIIKTLVYIAEVYNILELYINCIKNYKIHIFLQMITDEKNVS